MPESVLKEKRKPLVELINIRRLSLLSDYRQRIVLAEKINELIEKYNKLRGREKEAVRESMEALKKAVGYREEKDVNAYKNER